MRELARFSTTCPTCGELELTSDQMWLVLTSAGRAHYAFVCPDCGLHVRRTVDDDTAAMLAPFMAVEEIDVPAEAQESHDGPPLELDDLIDLMLDLEHELTASLD